MEDDKLHTYAAKELDIASEQLRRAHSCKTLCYSMAWFCAVVAVITAIRGWLTLVIIFTVLTFSWQIIGWASSRAELKWGMITKHWLYIVGMTAVGNSNGDKEDSESDVS